MPIWDFYCPTCNTTSEQWFANYTAASSAKCTKCGHDLERKPASGAFIVNGYNAKNLYSKGN